MCDYSDRIQFEKVGPDNWRRKSRSQHYMTMTKWMMGDERHETMPADQIAWERPNMGRWGQSSARYGDEFEWRLQSKAVTKSQTISKTTQRGCLDFVNNIYKHFSRVADFLKTWFLSMSGHRSRKVWNYFPTIIIIIPHIHRSSHQMFRRVTHTTSLVYIRL